MKTKKKLLCTMLLLLVGTTFYGKVLEKPVIQNNTEVERRIAMAKSRTSGNDSDTWAKVRTLEGEFELINNGDALTGLSVAMSADSTLVAMGFPEGSLADHSQKAEVVNTTSSITIEDEDIYYDADYEQTVRFSFSTATDFGEGDITVDNAAIVSGSLGEVTTGMEYTIRIKAQVTPTEPCITIALTAGFKTDNDIIDTEGIVSLSYVYFPDQFLRNFLVNYDRSEDNNIGEVDTNHDGLISCDEASNIVGDISILFSLDGIENMKDMTGFSAFSNFAGALHLRYNNGVETVDLTHNPHIKVLLFHGGNADNTLALKHLNVSTLTELENLTVYWTSIETLDVSNCTALKTLNVRDTPLRTLDLSQNNNIHNFRAQRNNLVSLDISNLRGSGILGGTLIVNENEKLKSLSIPSLEGAYVDIRDNTSLECITYNGNNLDVHDSSPGISEDHQELLTTNACVVQFNDSNFKEALVANTSINENQDSEISYAEATAYTGTINVSDKDISDMTGLNAFSNITGLDCSENNLRSDGALDLSNSPELEDLYCSDNALAEIDVSGNTLLKDLFCDENQIGDLDLSNNPALEQLNCSENGVYLTSLNLTNGNNENINSISATGNSNLDCIQVDDVVYSIYNWSNAIDGNTIFASGPDCYVQRAFITTWKTDNDGPSDNNQITIPTTSKYDYNYGVNWVNTENASSNGMAGPFTGSATITFPATGTYEVSIVGDFPTIPFGNGGDKDKILTVEQWGDIQWQTMYRVFYGCTNLDVTATDAPDLNAVTDTSGMFWDASSLTGENTDFNSWDVSEITKMNDVFREASAFNGDIGGWDTGNVTNMNSMFLGASAFTGDIGAWDVSSVAYMAWMFGRTSAFNQDLGSWNLSSIMAMNSLFTGATIDCVNYSATLIGWADNPNTNTNITLTNALPYGAHAVDAVNTLVSDKGWVIPENEGEDCYVQRAFITTWQTDNDGPSDDNQITIPTTNSYDYNYSVSWVNTGNASSSDTAGPFTESATITFPESGTYEVSITGDFPTIRFDNGGDKDKITAVTQWGDMEWQSMYRAFYGCTNLDVTATDAPDLNAVTDTSGMFWDASSFTGEDTDFNSWDVSEITNMEDMFYGASAFNQDLGSWNLVNVTNMDQLFTNSGMDCVNYSATLIGWAENLDINADIILSSRSYGVHAEDAVNTLVSEKGWVIPGEAYDCYVQRAFITTWEVGNNDYGDGDQSITIPTSGGGYNYTVDWGDGAIDNNQTGSAEHTYTTAGQKTVSITGDFPSIAFNYFGDKNKITEVNQWGTIQWKTMSTAFNGCTNLDVTAEDTPILDDVTEMGYMFAGATSLTLVNADDWNVSNVKAMNSLFNGASAFNGDLSGWDVSEVTNMGHMFHEADAFNQDISRWAVEKVEYLDNMFKGADAFNQNLGSWSLNSVMNIAGMFTDTSMDCSNYTDTLTGWGDNEDTVAASDETVSLALDVGDYDDSAADEVSNLVVAKGWTINGTEVTECPALSINNEVFNKSLSVSPNPVTSLLTINGPAGFELKSASVYSIIGKQVLSTTSTNIDTNNLPSGLYILKIENTEGQIAIKKIVKQ
ncbi:MAG: BspA family leucine-rich repeat surface protein [Algibacter sp.]